MKIVENSMTEYKYEALKNSSKNPLKVINSWHETQMWHSTQNMITLSKT